MKTTLAACAATVLLAATCGALAQSPAVAPPPSQAAERPAPPGAGGLNLKLDNSSMRRITSGTQEPARERAPGAASSALPALGGGTGRSFDSDALSRSKSPSGPGPFPKTVDTP